MRGTSVFFYSVPQDGAVFRRQGTPDPSAAAELRARLERSNLHPLGKGAWTPAATVADGTSVRRLTASSIMPPRWCHLRQEWNLKARQVPTALEGEGRPSSGRDHPGQRQFDARTIRVPTPFLPFV